MAELPLFICSSPTPYCFSGRIRAKVDKRAILTKKGSQFGRPHEPSWSWLSNNQFTHWRKKGACGEFGQGTIAIQAVSYEETNSSTSSNFFKILCFVPSMPCIKKIEIFIDAIDWYTRIEGNNLTECRVSYQNWSLGFCCCNWSRNQTNCLRTQYPTRDQRRYSYKRYPIEVTQSISLSYILRE